MIRTSTACAYDPLFILHDTGPGHPERPERLIRTLAHLEERPWFASLLSTDVCAADARWISAVHDPAYIERARTASVQGERWLDSPDVMIGDSSFDAALRACGAALALADGVLSGRTRNGFALLRPPGHHAERDLAMGFCIFNNAAITARYLQRKYGLERILILDWDVHHGNGTQHIFEEDPSVLYISTHQYPFYPGTGSSWETGVGKGAGATLNCPMKRGAGNAEFERAFVERILPATEAFRPDAVIVSAGFDAHKDDPLGELELTTDFYGWMTERVLEIADRHSNGRVISLLEGGYDLDALAQSVTTHLAVLSHNTPDVHRESSQ